MDAPGERDLAVLLASLEVVRRPGTFGYLTLAPDDAPPPDALAMIDEGTSRCYVVLDGPVFPSAWLTLQVHSSLDAVGLTAAVAAALAARSIPANVLAGLHHDHLLVPEHLAHAAIEALHELRG